MIIDSQNVFSSAQAITASGASTNLIDLGADNNLGIGEAMAVVITVDTAADGTTTDETYKFGVQADDNSSFSSPATVVERTIGYAALTAGSKHVIPIPPDTSMERYVRLYATLGGTTPSITFSAHLMPMSMLQNEVVYPKNYPIQ